MKKLFVLAMALILLGSCNALTPKEAVDYASANLGRLNKEVDGDQVPVDLISLFGNETANVFVAMEDGSTEVIGVKAAKGKITGLKYKGYANPSVNGYISEQTLWEIYESDNRTKAGLNAFYSGKIRYVGVGWFNFIKFSLIGLAQKTLTFSLPFI